ncbi:CD48 antigen-like isoform X1 [Pygocentrus nattereri]|uniref:CD48 antigen-like isoform X1 n=1 Tax=Pygocentrus nattereri TaxID=42514 RepID=UPI0018914724|nr:CD48 antigen-like isoform X1 [Pygocentrus nattereri]
MIMEYKIRRALACLCCCLLCSAGEEVVRLQELEGNTVTIHTGLTGVQSDARILWFYGPETINSNIVDSQVIDGNTSTDFYRDRFKDRLQLNRTSGSLTISNISKEDSGVYILEVIAGNTSVWSFSVNVCAPVSQLSVRSQSSKKPQKSLAAVLTPVGLEIVAISLLIFMWFWKKRSKEKGQKEEGSSAEVTEEQDQSDPVKQLSGCNSVFLQQ